MSDDHPREHDVATTDYPARENGLATGDEHRGSGAQCASCRAPVAADQHYCLSCGARQTAPRVPFGELLARSTVGGGFAPRPPAEPGSPASGAPARDWTPAVALGGLGALALVLVIGVLIGRSGGSAPTKQAAAQVITVAGGGGAAAATPTTTDASATSISDDWPAGKSGYTVELQTVPKAAATSATVSAAKSAASGKGAPAVGVLDAANYTSLGSDYVIYSGDYPTDAKAKAALAAVRKSFPGAKVIHVVPSGGGAGGASTTAGGAVAGGAAPVSAAQAQQSSGTLNSLSSCTGANCSKNARKITTPVAVGGTAPPVDNKNPGAGSAAQTIN
jgi:hypothetical protein